MSSRALAVLAVLVALGTLVPPLDPNMYAFGNERSWGQWILFWGLLAAVPITFGHRVTLPERVLAVLPLCAFLVWHQWSVPRYGAQDFTGLVGVPKYVVPTVLVWLLAFPARRYVRRVIRMPVRGRRGLL